MTNHPRIKPGSPKGKADIKTLVPCSTFVSLNLLLRHGIAQKICSSAVCNKNARQSATQNTVTCSQIKTERDVTPLCLVPRQQVGIERQVSKNRSLPNK